MSNSITGNNNPITNVQQNQSTSDAPPLTSSTGALNPVGTNSDGLLGRISNMAVGAFNSVMPFASDLRIRQEMYTEPLSKMPENAHNLAAHMVSDEYHKKLTGNEEEIDTQDLSEKENNWAQQNALKRLASIVPDHKDQNEVLAGVHQDSEHHDLGTIYNHLLREEKEIFAQEKRLSPDQITTASAEANLTVWEHLSKGASAERNHQMDKTRAAISTLGRMVSHFMKSTGLPYQQVLDKKANITIKELNNPEITTFDQLPDWAKIKVYQDVVASAGKANPHVAEKFKKTVVAMLPDVTKMLPWGQQ